MSTPAILRFVHFSDIHFGQEGPDALPLHNDIREEAIRDCRRVCAEGIVSGPATAVLVTGDIAYGGRDSEYVRAGEWLDKVTEAAGCDRLAVRMVPGNHDVDWTKLGAAGKSLQQMLRNLDVGECQRQLSDALKEVNSPLIAKLDSYLSFAEAYECSFTDPNSPFHTKDYALAGGKSLRLVGLCSVLISDRDDTQDKLFLGRSQYTIPRDDNVEPVVMLHHPLEWYKDSQYAKPYLQQRARLILTGHEHLSEITKKETNDHEQLHLAAGAMNPPQSTSIHNYTYNWIEFSWENDGAVNYLVAKVFPRAWNVAKTQFDLDHNRASQGYSIVRLNTKSAPPQKIASPITREALPRGGTADSAHEQRTPFFDSELAVLDPPRSEEAMSKESDPEPQDPNEHHYDVLRFIFWRHINREKRQEILRTQGFLPSGNVSVPHSIETAAFNKALATTDTAKKLWDATMIELPEANRLPNPFARGE